MIKLLLFTALLSISPVSAAAAEEVAIPRFDLKAISLIGNSLLPASEVSSLFQKYYGPQKDFGTLQEAIDDLEKAYRNRGYSMVTVLLPEQELEGGVVVLRVMESRVKEITVSGNSHFDRDNILASLPALKTGVPPNVTAISETLRAANENPAKKVTLQFRVKDKAEELDARIDVKDQKPWKVALNGDNSGNSQTGYYRTGISLQHANLFNLDHVAAFQYTTSPDHAKDVLMINGSYRIPLYSLGDTIDFFGGYSDVNNGTSKISGTDLSVSGKGIVSGFRYNLTLPRSGAFEQKLQAGMDYRVYDNTVNILGVDVAKDVVAHPFSLTYGASWSNELVSADGYIGLLNNQPWGGQGKTADFTAVRNGAAADYRILRYGFNKMTRLPADWLVRVFGSGQYTPDRLIPGEQFGLGGAASVRGYKEREESYDAGFGGSLELYGPDISRIAGYESVQLRLVAFFDGGTGYNLRPQAGESTANSMTSLGAGLRLGVGDRLSFSFDWGYALNRGIGAATSVFTPTERGDNALHFKGSITY